MRTSEDGVAETMVKNAGNEAMRSIRPRIFAAIIMPVFSCACYVLQCALRNLPLLYSIL